MYIRKRICLVFSVVLLIFAAAGAYGETVEPDYYSIGLEVTSLMSEITDSEAYLSMLAFPESFSEVREKVNTHDYNRPVAVYSVRTADPEVLLKEMLQNDNESLETWNSLSPALQEQVLGRLGIQALCSSFNSRQSTDCILFASVSTAFVRNENLTAGNAVSYLYLFEEGTPILVSFGYHAASGLFLFIPKESQASRETVCAALAWPGLELTPVVLPDTAVSDRFANLAAHGAQLPASVRSPSSRYELFDVTEDGCVDLCTCVTWGSGMVRTDLIVYDPVNDVSYVLDGYSFDYLIDHVEEERLVIVKEGPHGYGDPVTRTYGTVRLVENQLVFLADSEGA